MERKDWWQTIFQEDYLTLYQNELSPQRTVRETDFILSHVPLPRKARVLDIPCGNGRHAIEFARRGYEVTGIDLSSVFLEQARAEAEKRHVSITFIHGDMRMPLSCEPVDLVVNVFTSFGYFKRLRENERVLKMMAGALKPGGYFFIDTANKSHLLTRVHQSQNISPQPIKLPDGSLLTTHERITRSSRWVVDVTHKKMGRTWTYHADVKLFSEAELTALLAQYGLRVIKTWGNFRGDALTDQSPRMILLAKKQ